MRALPKLFVVLAMAALLGAGAFAWLEVVRTLEHPNPVVAPNGAPFPNGIVWGGRVFQSPRELERWLRSKGASYSRWRRRFPAEARVLEHRPPLSTTSPPVTKAAAAARATRRSHATTSKSARRTQATQAEHTAAPATAGSRRDLLLWIVIVALGGALLAIAARVVRYAFE